jgi:hypothetical protein
MGTAVAVYTGSKVCPFYCQRPVGSKWLTFGVTLLPWGGDPYATHGQSGGFDTGAAAVRLPAIGRPSQVARISPMEPPRGVPVSNPPRLGDFPGVLRPMLLPFAPADRRQEPAGLERSGRPAAPAKSAARAAPRGRLETVENVLTDSRVRQSAPLIGNGSTDRSLSTPG